jgi:serine/threonine protein kinase
VGAIIFEMLTGEPPFRNNGDKEQLFDDIRKCNIEWPSGISATCKDLLRKLFIIDPNLRLGGGPGDGEEVKSHPWFSGVDWEAIHNKQIKPPFKPKLQGEEDIKYIDKTFTD